MFTQRPVLVRGELRWKGPCVVWMLRMVCAFWNPQDFAHRALPDWLTGLGSKSEGATIMEILRLFKSS